MDICNTGSILCKMKIHLVVFCSRTLFIYNPRLIGSYNFGTKLCVKRRMSISRKEASKDRTGKSVVNGGSQQPDMCLPHCEGQ